jgi:hypothetical protein
VIRVPQIVASMPSDASFNNFCLTIPSTKVRYTYYDPVKKTAFENLTYMIVKEDGNELVITFIDAPLGDPIKLERQWVMENLQSGKRLIEFSFVTNINSPTLLDPSVLRDIEVIPEVESIFFFKDSWV